MAKKRKQSAGAAASRSASRTRRSPPMARMLGRVANAPALNSATMTIMEENINTEPIRLTLKSALKTSDSSPSPPWIGKKHARFNSVTAEKSNSDTRLSSSSATSSRKSRSTRANSLSDQTEDFRDMSEDPIDFNPAFYHVKEQREQDFSPHYQTGQTVAQLQSSILHQPRPLSLPEISNLLTYTQHDLAAFAATHFSFALTPEQATIFSLAHLPVAHPELYRATQYIADGSQSGWLHFFTSPASRPHLVHALLGEIITHHILNNSCFGLSKPELAEIEQVDVLYLNWDGFVRTKERGRLLAQLLAAKSHQAFESDLNHAVAALTTATLHLLAPLMPAYYGLHRHETRPILRDELSSLFRLAASLHLSIRLTGANGTILSYQSPTKHSPFSLSVSRSVSRCVNEPAILAAAANVARNDRVVVKMSCFPRVTATVPVGADLKEYARLQDLKNGNNNQNNNKRKKKHMDEGEWSSPFYVDADIVDAVAASAPILPAPLQNAHTAQMLRRNLLPSTAAPASKVNGALRGAYVLTSPLNRADVYCGWVEMETPCSPKKRQTSKVEADKNLTLHQAAYLARTGELPRADMPGPEAERDAERKARRWRKRDLLPLTAWGVGGVSLALLVAGVCMGEQLDVKLAETVGEVRRVLGQTTRWAGVAKEVGRRVVGVGSLREGIVSGMGMRTRMIVSRLRDGLRGNEAR